MNCELCNDTKLIPFVNKQGQLRNDAFLDCECKVDEPAHHQQKTLEAKALRIPRDLSSSVPQKR